MENRGISEESIPRSGRTEGRSCGRFRSFSVVSGRFPSHFWRKSENFREYRGISEKIIPFLSFSFLFIPQPHVFMLYNIKKSFSLKFLAFYLAVPDFLLTFANAYKTIVIYPARRPLSPMASSRRLFLCLGKSFF